MSIAHVYLRHAKPIKEGEIEHVTRSIFDTLAFARGISTAIAYKREDYDLPEDIAQAVLSVPHAYIPGTASVSPVTSKWAKETFPNAQYVLRLSVVRLDGNKPHFLFVYIP